MPMVRPLDNLGVDRNTGLPKTAAPWILVATDGTCSSKEYNTPYRIEADGTSVALNSKPKKFAATGGATYSNKSFVRRFHDDVQIGDGNKKFLEGGDASGLWVLDTVKSAVSFLSSALRRRPNARIALVGHSRGAMVSVLLAAWLRGEGKTVDFMGLYDAVDRTPNLQAAARGGALGGAASGPHGAALGVAIGLVSKEGMNASLIPGNVRRVRHAVRDRTTGSRWWFGNTAMRWEGHSAAEFIEYFRATHGAMGGAIPHGCNGQWYGFVVEDSCWAGRGLGKDENTREGERANRWVREGARSAGIAVG